jgi:predicted nucleic acid-binding Zn ribbon protein
VSPAKKRPSSIADVLPNVLKDAGIAARVQQAALLPEWSTLVGPQISRVTEPMSITADGTLFVNVATNAWMNELSLLEPELLRALNVKAGSAPVKRIRWLLKRV